jgi:Tfp pilus assembly protein PilX
VSRSARGFILATTLLVMTLLTVMLAAAFMMISAEFRTTNGAYSSNRALSVAQAGLQTYLANPHNLSGGYDSTNYAAPGGYARVVARRLRDSTSTSRAVWIVISTGVDSTPPMVLQGTGRRIVAQLAWMDPGTLPARAAMVAPNGVQMVANGTNPIDGDNFGFITTGCVTPPNPDDDTLGLATAAGGYGGSPGANPGRGIEYLPSPATVIDSTRIDWARLVAGEFTPDFIGTLPAPCSGAGCQYRTYLHTGDVTIPASHPTPRRGLLVVHGNVTLANNAHWDGVIVAGGNLDANVNGTFYIHGMIITGLNISLGQPVSANQVRRGGSRSIRWDWCYARSAITSLSYLTPIRGTYTDSWDTY